MSIRLNAAATPMSIRLKANGGTASLRLTQGRTGPTGPAGPQGDPGPALPQDQLAELDATYAPGGAWTKGRTYAVGDIVTTALGHRLRCIEAHTASATVLTDDLPKWTAAEQPPREPMLLQLARAAKGGGIGVGDKPVVAFRFDDDHEAFAANIYPLFITRGVPAGHASISDLSSQPWSANTTPAQVKTRFQRGIEVWSHGLDHKDPSPHDLMGPGGLADQIVYSKDTIESWGVKCQGWMQPGATPVGSAVPYGDTGTTHDSLESYHYFLIRNTYALSESEVAGVRREIPQGMYHGLSHDTISDGATLATATAALDRAIIGGWGIEFMVHSANLGKPGNMTVAEFTTFLDDVVARWDAGTIEVLTPSGLMFADRTNNRLQLVTDPHFDRGEWTLGSGQYERTIETSGGYGGDTNFLRFPSTNTALASPVWRAPLLKRRNLNGETFLFEGWARSNGTGTASARAIFQDYPLVDMNLSVSRTVTTSWTRVRHAFSIPTTADEFTWGIGRDGGDGVDWSNVTIRKV